MRAAVFSFSERGARLSKRIGTYLQSIGCEAELQTVARYAEVVGLPPMLPDHHAACARAFSECQLLIFVGAAGIAVRTIAPLLRHKAVDPAVLSVDEQGSFVIPLLSGHIGGANELARCLAATLGAVPCVTTATDVNQLFAVDEWAARNHMTIVSLKEAKEFAAALVRGEEVGLYHDPEFELVGELPKQLRLDSTLPIGMAVTLRQELQPFATTVRLLPCIVHLGIGCRRNTPLENIEALVLPKLAELQLDKRCVSAIASVDLKKDEQGLLAFAEKYGFAAHFYTAAELNSVDGDFTASSFVKSVVGVSNVCERSAVLDSGGGRLLMRKTSLNGVTLAVAVEQLSLELAKTSLRTE